MEASLISILNSPKFPVLMEELQFKLSEEVKARARFLNEIKETDKAEFINGEVIYHSPARFAHVSVSGLIFNLLKNYCKKHKLGFVGAEKMMISLTRNDYEPDICFFSKEKASKFSKDKMRFPPPDLIVEILSKSTEKNDRGIKFEDYAAHGVMEYWIIDPDNEELEQYFLKNGVYELNQKSSTGFVKSIAVKDFVIPVRAIFDEEENMKALQEIMNYEL